MTSTGRGTAKSSHELDAPPVDPRVDQPGGDGADAVLPGGDRAGRERLGDQPAVPGVVGGVGCDQHRQPGMAFVLGRLDPGQLLPGEGHQGPRAAGGEGGGVAQHLQDQVVAGDEVLLARLDPVHRVLGPHALVVGVGALAGLRVGRVEGHRASTRSWWRGSPARPGGRGRPRGLRCREPARHRWRRRGRIAKRSREQLLRGLELLPAGVGGDEGHAPTVVGGRLALDPALLLEPGRQRRHGRPAHRAVPGQLEGSLRARGRWR